ncbi:MAG: beta-propeller domain-containing protein [Deltaproteobacteria bacterium]|nr:beta-propeller domain-containing protein [Deltaproteobacteria bacterium]
MKTYLKCLMIIGLFLLTLHCSAQKLGTGPDPDPEKTGLGALRQLSSCDELVAYYEDLAESSGSACNRDDVDCSAESGGSDDSADADSDTETDASTESEDHEVAEADLAKSYDDRLLTSHGNDIYLYQVSPVDEARLLSTLELSGTIEELFLGDNWAAVFTVHNNYNDDDLMIADVSSENRLWLIDLSDPENPVVARTIAIEEDYVTARYDSTDEVLYWVAQGYRSTDTRELEEIVPHGALDDDETDLQEDDCANVLVYEGGNEYDHNYWVSVVALPLSDGLESSPISTGLVMGVPYETFVRATEENLLVAIQNDTDSTSIFSFDYFKGNTFEVKSAGFIDGYLNDQFSMDSEDGLVRVVFTQRDDDWNRSNYLKILKNDGGELETLAVVGPFGEGEEVYASHFTDDWGYVVTYMSIDPLFTIDLSDPENPSLTGALEVPGFSTYLESVDEDHLLSVGVSDRWDGSVQLSLFDVSDRSNPSLKFSHAFEDLPDGSEALGDHRAFSYFEEEGIIAVPISGYDYEITGDGYYDSIGRSYLTITSIDVDSGFNAEASLSAADVFTISESETECDWAFRRTLMVDETLVAVTNGGIALFGKDDLTAAVSTFAYARESDETNYCDSGNVEMDVFISID